jgi:Tfp pilus assembly protein PilF
MSIGLIYLMLSVIIMPGGTLKEAIRLEPNYAKGHFALGVVYLELDDRGAVLEEYKIAPSLDRELDNKLVRLLEK